MTGVEVGEAGDVERFAAAGLYDPSLPRAEERLGLLRWLASQGLAIDDMVVANRTGDLVALAGDALRHAGVELSINDVAERTDLTVEELIEVRRATGLAPVPVDVPVYTEHDVEAFRTLGGAAELFSWPELLQFLRVVGSSLARIAHAGNTLFLGDVERPLRARGAAELDLARRMVSAGNLAVGLTTVFGTIFRSHLDQEVSRSRQAYGRATGGPRTLVPMAVGFVDLVGFTQQAATMDADALTELVARFEATAHDTVTDLGGRLVKLIGDEVMFVAVEASTACDIAVALLEVFEDVALMPRGGLAHGDVLARSGDYFGPIVNLAARLAEQAVPGEVLATPDVVAAADRPVRSAGRRMLKGFADPVEVVSLTA